MAKSKAARKKEAVEKLDSSMDVMANNWRKQAGALKKVFPLISRTLYLAADLMDVYKAGLANIDKELK